MHLSLEQILKYRNCPISYYFQYISGATAMNNRASLYFQEGIRKTVAHFCIRFQKLKNPTIEAALNVFSKYWENRPPNLIYPRNSNWKKMEIDGLEWIKDIYYRLVGISKIRNSQPLQQSQPVIFTHDGHLIATTCDIILSNNYGEPVLYFLNFDRTEPTKEILENDLKITATVYAFRQTFGVREHSIKVYNFPSKNEITTLRTGSHFNRMKIELTGILRGLTNDAYYSIIDWRCNKCPFKISCHNSKTLILTETKKKK